MVGDGRWGEPLSYSDSSGAAMSLLLNSNLRFQRQIDGRIEDLVEGVVDLPEGRVGDVVVSDNSACGTVNSWQAGGSRAI